MSRKRRKSNSTSLNRGPRSDFLVSKAKAVESSAHPSRKWRLPALVWTAVLLGAGSYYWFESATSPQIAVPRHSAVDTFRQALLVDPENDWAHYNLGLELQGQGKLDEAIAHYRQAIAIAGDDAGYHNNLGVALAAQGKLEEAIGQFTRAIQCDPGNAESQFNFGNALISQGKLEEAKVHYRRAIELQPDYAKAHNNLAVALKKTGHLKEAYRQRSEAMRLERAQQGGDSPDPIRSD